MKKEFYVISLLALLNTTSVMADKKVDKQVADSTSQNIGTGKTEKNRNEMLNAENSVGPRNVNIGLPFQGDVTIMENDVPVVYYYYPTSPLLAWRYDNSLGSMGLMSFAESAIKTGKVGYAVQSSDRGASRKFHGYASVYLNSFGSSRYDATITGPITKNGWGYMLSFYKAFDRGYGQNLQYTSWSDDATQFKAGIEKKYKNGSIRLLYKMISVKDQLGTYVPLIYKGNGETEELDNFRLGKDAFVVGDGMIPYYDGYTGEAKYASLDDNDFSRAVTHSVYLQGDHKFQGGFLNKWKLNYTLMYSYNKTPFVINFPVTLMSKMPDQQEGETYYYHGTNKQYTGSVAFVSTTVIPKSTNKYMTGRAEITRKLKDHDWRLGLNYQNNHRQLISQSSMYVMSVEANPSILDYYMTVNYGGQTYSINQSNETNGALSTNWSGGYGTNTDDHYNKIALYGSDDWKITNRWNVYYGGRIEYQNKRDVHYAVGYSGGTYSKVYQTLSECDVLKKTFNDVNYVGALSTVYKLTSKFGLLADGSYNSWVDTYWDYENRDENNNPIADSEGLVRQTKPGSYRNNVMNLGAGVYFNLGSVLSVVSKITYIKKENVRYNNANITNPENTSERQDCGPIYYDISTLGWTTDVLTNPFKNFNMHFLFTWQKPQYKNFEYQAFNVQYNYNNNIIPELSQVLMEIDPSYTMMKGKLKAWLSLRYFGKQYSNPTNAFYYNGWWENFCGLDYTVSRSVSLKLQVVNFLDQSGVKGAVQGADQVKDASSYVNRIIVANCIRPRTIELTANVKF